MRLSFHGKDVTQTSVEESYNDCKPKNVHHEFLQFHTYGVVCKKLTPLVTMAKLQQAPFGDLVMTRHRGGIAADHVLRQGVHLNAACIQVVFDLVPIGCLAQVCQQMAQPVVTKIQWLDDLRG